MEYINEMNALKNMVNSLTLDEKNYLRYIRMKENGKKHWMNKKHFKIG